MNKGLFSLIPVISNQDVVAYQVLYVGINLGEIKLDGTLVTEYANNFDDKYFVEHGIIDQAVKLVKEAA